MDGFCIHLQYSFGSYFWCGFLVLDYEKGRFVKCHQPRIFASSRQSVVFLRQIFVCALCSNLMRFSFSFKNSFLILYQNKKPCNCLSNCMVFLLHNTKSTRFLTFGVLSDPLSEPSPPPPPEPLPELLEPEPYSPILLWS